MKDMADLDSRLVAFADESNRIEGLGPASTQEVAALRGLLWVARVEVVNLEAYVSVVQPGATLRVEPGLDVRIGNHVPPPGGPAIRAALTHIVTLARGGYPLYELHHQYEKLHPFTDGNGRSGRALWLWQQKQRGEAAYRRALELGFLHSWYYDSLAEWRVESLP